MHELSIAHSIVGAVTQALEAEGGGRVSRVDVEVGVLSGVVPEALLFCYDIATSDTPLAGSQLAITRVPLAIWCTPCAAEREIGEVVRFRCPVCDVPSGDIRRGRELDIRSFALSSPVELLHESHGNDVAVAIGAAP